MLATATPRRLPLRVLVYGGMRSNVPPRGSLSAWGGRWRSCLPCVDDLGCGGLQRLGCVGEAGGVVMSGARPRRHADAAAGVVLSPGRLGVLLSCGQEARGPARLWAGMGFRSQSTCCGGMKVGCRSA